MHVLNAVLSERQQAKTFFGAEEDGPLVMVNLLKFHPTAQYEDGSDADLSGARAYGRYGAEVTKLIEGLGGRVRFSGKVTGLMIGEVEELWDAVLLVEYPTLAAFQAMIRSPQMRAIEHHRKAGLAGQLNIRVKPGMGF